MAPVNTMTPPGIPFVSGQLSVNVNCGVVRTAQLVVAVATTGQIFRPLAVRVTPIEQTLVGTISLPAKALDSPLVNIGKLATKLVLVTRTLSLKTVTLVRELVPVLLTIPLNVNTPPGTPFVDGH